MESKISADDLQDVRELTEKLFDYMDNLFEDHDPSIMKNVLMGSFAAILFKMSHSEQELIFNCSVFFEILKKMAADEKD